MLDAFTGKIAERDEVDVGRDFVDDGLIFGGTLQSKQCGFSPCIPQVRVEPLEAGTKLYGDEAHSEYLDNISCRALNGTQSFTWVSISGSKYRSVPFVDIVRFNFEPEYFIGLREVLEVL